VLCQLHHGADYFVAVGSKELRLWLFNWCFSLLLFVQGKGRQKRGRRLISLEGTCVALKNHHAVEDVIL